MTDLRAIEGISATLQTLLRDRMEVPDSEDPVLVTISTPNDQQDTDSRRVNLFLYRVTENDYLKNQEIPGIGHPATYGYPPLCLDLNYLLTAYGTSADGEFTSEVRAHWVLGNAMRVLHDHPVITERLERMRVAPIGAPMLDQSLRGEFEQVKLHLEPISLEDLSKVWTSLMLPCRLSAAYKVSVVQIESQRPRRFPRPVGELPARGPRVYVLPFRSPQINEVHVIRWDDPDRRVKPFPYARIGDTLVIKGRNLAGEATRVILGAVDATAQITDLQDSRIEVTIPNDERLLPGPQPMTVVRDIMMGEPPEPHRGFQSNLAVFMLVPRIDSRTPSLGTVPRTLRIQGERLFHDTLTGETLVGPALTPKATYLSATPTDITIALPDTLPAWPVQCLISGTLPSSLSLTATTPEVQVTIGRDGPHMATFPKKPITPTEAAQYLQAAIRSAPDGGPAFKGTRVTIVDSQLVVVPEGLLDTVTIAPISSDPTTASELLLDVGAAVQAYLSGELMPFPTLTASQPAVRVTIGGVPHVATLATRPATLAGAVAKLEAAIQGAGSEPGFTGTRVTTLENQLLILPGAAGNVVFEGVAGIDEASVAELQLDVHYPVRVRVNGAESIDDESLRLPRP